MLPMDMPYVPVQSPSIVLAQAAARGATSPPDYILKACMETAGTGDLGMPAALVEPDGMLATYMQKQSRRYVDISAVKNVVLLKNTAHGKIVANTAPSGRQYYTYVPAKKHQGNDSAVFMAEYAGSRFRIDVSLHVLPVAGKKKKTTCPPMQLIKAGKPALGSSGYNSNPAPGSFAASHNGSGYASSSMTIMLGSVLRFSA